MLTYDPSKDAYAILGVDPAATQKEVSAAYRKAALTWHPDKSVAPDAHERFLDVKAAARILRDKRLRAQYDRLRRLALGASAESRKRKDTPPEPFVPMPPPPSWMVDAVRVNFDAVLINLRLPSIQTPQARVANGLALVSLGAGLTTGRPIFGALAFVLWAFGRVLVRPPHAGVMAWAKLIPGRKQAEYHVFDQSAGRYDKLRVPYTKLRVGIVESTLGYRLVIEGFPRAAMPVLFHTRDYDEAKRCAREAGQWLQMPYKAAA